MKILALKVDGRKFPKLARYVKRCGIRIGDEVASIKDDADHLGVVLNFLVGVDHNAWDHRVAVRVSNHSEYQWLSDLVLCPSPQNAAKRANALRENHYRNMLDDLEVCDG